MDYMTELAAIANKNGGIIETKTAAQHGISKAMLYKLCKAEKIHRIVKGQYVLPEDMQDELLSISRRSGKIIFSHETALFLHGISDRTPFEHTVTAPSGCIPSAAIKAECKVYRCTTSNRSCLSWAKQCWKLPLGIPSPATIWSAPSAM